ncbi:MAG TPA: ATP-dependent DNA ligase [Acidimicrobiales bacterium]|nr:ATP-dependent DNA ligase [Acidimicrobiales bacterium]
MRQGISLPLADVVATSAEVASTRARSAKVSALAELVRRVPAPEVAVVVGFLVGAPRQGRVGVGWALLGPTAELAPAGEPTLTVADVDAAIDALDAATGSGSTAARRRIVDDLFGRATADEADFLRRLLIGDLRQGALEGVMTDAIAKAAAVPIAVVRRAAMLAGDLCRVAADALDGGEEALTSIGLEVLRPVLPMLAATAATVGDAIEANGPSSVEWKLDGARIQAHRQGDVVRLFTRNLNEVTDRLPSVVKVVRALPVDAVILDGEVYGTAVSEDGAGPFQDTMSRFSRHEPDADGELHVRFFDVLHVDGHDLIDEPLEQRLVVLARSVAEPNRVPGIITADASEAQAFADGALALGHEGVMVKSLTSLYEAGRRGSAWRKVKPVRTLDLVVLGAEWGHGRRRGWLSNLHLGARDPDTGEFVMVGKTFKGLTDALLTWQTEELLARETHREGIIVFVRPELVVEIALDGAQRSPRYPGGVALRFARVKRYRDDKSPADADTIDAVRALLP